MLRHTTLTEVELIFCHDGFLASFGEEVPLAVAVLIKGGGNSAYDVAQTADLLLDFSG